MIGGPVSRLRVTHLMIVVGLVAAVGARADWALARPAPAATHADIALALDAITVRALVPPNATLETLLRAQNVSTDIAAALVGAVRGVFDPRALRAKQPYRLTRTLGGLFREFRYDIDATRFLRVVFKSRRADGGPEFDVSVVPYPREIAVETASAAITPAQPSLVEALGGSGGGVQLALLLADIFGGEVDFNTELQRGDRVDVLYERLRREGQDVGYGDIEAAVLENSGRRLTAIRFVDAAGKAEWYDEHGLSLKRQFLRSPLPFEPRITSGFSYNRLHPIFGDHRAHLGVDYHADAGTPIVAVAAGVVEVADWSGNAGRMVEIRHAGGYETAYLHLSSFAAGIHRGARVEQGELIGRVGSSGAATGPHLDYRIKRNGVYVNPVLELSRMPKGDPIPVDRRDAFAAVRDRLLAQLAARVHG